MKVPANHVSRHIRSNAIAYAALFFAITGSAAAMSKFHAARPQIRNKNLVTGAVNSRSIADHAIHAKDLHRNSVNGGAIAEGSIHGGDLAANTVTGFQVNEASLDPDVLQFRIKGDCPPGSAIRSVGPDGEVICESSAVNGLTGLTTSDGLTGGGTSGTVNVGVDPTKIQSRVSGTCTGESAIDSVNQDGTVGCQNTGTVTSVDTGFGLAGGPITGSGTISADTTVLQQRVNGVCTGNNALRAIGIGGEAGCTHFVTRVVAGKGLDGGSIIDQGVIDADTTFLQRRVRGSCSGTRAIQAVNQDGTVTCSGGTVGSAHALAPAMVEVNPGGSAALLSGNGIQLVGTCAPGPVANVDLRSSGGQVTALASSRSRGFVEATTAAGARLASTASGDRGDFNSFRGEGGTTLDGSFMALVAGGKCAFEASGIAG